MDNQEKPPETFADLPQARQKAWSSLPETQLFLQQLEKDRATAQHNLNVSCNPNGFRERSVFELGKIAILDYCINTIEDGQR